MAGTAVMATTTIAVMGWFLIPCISFYVNKLLSYIDFGLSRKLRDLERDIIPSLKRVLRYVTEQRMLRGAKVKGNGSESELTILSELDKDLKSALCNAEDVLDLVEYHRIEKEVIGDDGKSLGTMIRNGVLEAIGDWIARCNRSSFGQKLGQCAQNQYRKLRDLGDKLQQCAQDLDLKFWELVAKLQQYAKYLNKMFWDFQAKLVHFQGDAGQPSMPDAPSARSTAESRDDIEQGSATTPSTTPVDAPSNPPMPTALPNSSGSATEFRDDNQHGSSAEAPMLDAPTNSPVKIAWDCFGYALLRLWSFYLDQCRRRDEFWKDYRIKKDGNVPIIERIRLWKQIKSIEDILTSSEKSNQLNQNSSSTPKDADKDSSSCTLKNSAEESTNTQKEIDDVYRSIEKKVFGRDKDREHISKMLREGSGTNAASSSTRIPYSVVGIYGITGSGKSTLAQYVCDYEKGAGYFNLIMFILVGKAFSVHDIFREMLDQIKQQQASNTEDPKSIITELKDLKSLKAELEKQLKGVRLLLVLDDLWVNADNEKEHSSVKKNEKEHKEREILLDGLRVGQSGSRILVTAQKKDAAAALGAEEKMQIPIPDLEEEQYLSMFMHYSLGVSQITSTDHHKYKEIARKIVKKLGKSPIAARTVAARLKSNNSTNFWETTANLDVLNETMGALWWSYQLLGGDIRRCFTYCRIFPKGYVIKRDMLVRLWIAQGFVNTRNNATEELEDIGQSYFDQLLTFSFLQVQRTYFGEAFTIHDLLHELAERVSGSEFYRIDLNGLPKDIPRGVHHLYIETNNAAEIAEKILDLGNLRTLIIKEPDAWSMKSVERNLDLEKLLERLFMRLTKLRVLIIKLNNGTKELSVPASIDQMKHLRYLGIHYGHDFLNLILPSTFSKLYHIQIIDIPCPVDMSTPLSFPNIGRLTALQTLERFHVKEEPGHELKQLMHLNSLRDTLYITGLGIVGSAEEAAEAHLNHKKRLRILMLDFGSTKIREPNMEAEVLEGLCPPKDLQELRIFWYRGSRYPSWMLSRHNSDIPKQLHRLELWYCSQLLSIPEGSELFIGLRELGIYGCESCDWDSLPENMERLVSLQTLGILYCKKLEHIPTLPQALKMIEIRWCASLRSIGIMDFPRLELKLEKEKRLEACTSQEYCQDTAPTVTPEQPPYPMFPCPCLVTLVIRDCANLVTLANLPPSLKNLEIVYCWELCSVSGQLGQLEKLEITGCNKLQSLSLGYASSLEILSLSYCKSIASLGSSGGPGTFSALRKLRIKDCPAMDMKQFNKNVLDGLELKDISYALSSNPHERT